VLNRISCYHVVDVIGGDCARTLDGLTCVCVAATGEHAYDSRGTGVTRNTWVAAFADADEFNARLVSSHRLVGAEALVDELDTTFRALRAEVAELTAEQIRSRCEPTGKKQ